MPVIEHPNHLISTLLIKVGAALSRGDHYSRTVVIGKVLGIDGHFTVSIDSRQTGLMRNGSLSILDLNLLDLGGLVAVSIIINPSDLIGSLAVIMQRIMGSSYHFAQTSIQGSRSIIDGNLTSSREWWQVVFKRSRC